MWVFSLRLGIRLYIRPAPRGIHMHPAKKNKIRNIISLITKIHCSKIENFLKNVVSTTEISIPGNE